MTNANYLLSVFNPEIPKKILMQQIKKERLLFLALCSDYDKEILLSEKPLSFSDFERITYLAEVLGLNNYLNHLYNIYPDLLTKLGDSIESVVNSPDFDPKEDAQKYYIWEKEFTDQLPTEKMRKTIKQLIETK